MRWIRFFFAILSANFRGKISIMDETYIPFRVWVTDIDVFVMNHAAMLTVFEMGRIDFMVRLGFFKLAIKNKWYFPSKSINAQFLRPLKILQKAHLITKILHVEEPWVYIEQKIVRNGKDVAICVAKSTVKKGRKNISAEEIAKALKINEFPTGKKQIVDSYEKESNIILKQLIAE